ncbi:MAG: hypothetical protein IPK82_44235 [Polyangiaceae bacterium]|nr:hypothetical protein [Polyangiaceae bacterium]
MAELILAGSGLVSPLGLGVIEHVFYTRASVSAPAPAAFETAVGDRLEVAHCGFLGAAAPPAERLSRLAEIAAHQALAPWEGASGPRSVALVFIAPQRAGLDTAAVAQARDRVAQRARAVSVQTRTGAAAAFAAISQARTWLDTPDITAVLVVAVDSHIAVDALVDFFEHTDSPFARRTPPPAEGAAAWLLTSRERARALGLRGPLVVAASTALGQGHDNDDTIVDGRALTSLMDGLPPSRVELVCGQELVDDLRSRDWFLAHARFSHDGAAGGPKPRANSARIANRFSDTTQLVTLEQETGRLGAAAGVAAVAFGAGQLAHGVFAEIAPEAPLLAWAISTDGTRGVALLNGAEASRFMSTHAIPKLSAVEPVNREPLTSLLQQVKKQDDAGVESNLPTAEVADDTPPNLPDLTNLLSQALTAGNDTSGNELPTGAPPVEKSVQLRKGQGAPVSLAVSYSEIAAACLDGMALAANHRHSLRWDNRLREEERILAFTDALTVTARFVSWTGAWWEEAVDLPDPWKIWSPVFLLGCLRGDDVVEGLRGLLRSLPEEEAESAAIAGEALASTPSVDRSALFSVLLSDSHSCTQAAALRAQSLVGEIQVEAVLNALAPTAHRTLALAAARAAGRSFAGDARVDECLLACVHTASDPDFLWEILRALALRGHATAYHAMLHDPSLLVRLGARALDVLAFFGADTDAAVARTVVSRSGLTSRVLLGLGRYGHPGAAPLMIRALSDEDHAEDAANALVWMFGEPFGEDEVESPEAWKNWLKTTRFAENTRLRFGKPYRPSCVAEAAAEGARSQVDIGFMLDEAYVRCGFTCPPDLSGWSPKVNAALAQATSVLAAESGTFAADPWRSVTRSKRAAR